MNLLERSDNPPQPLRPLAGGSILVQRTLFFYFNCSAFSCFCWHCLARALVVRARTVNMSFRRIPLEVVGLVLDHCSVSCLVHAAHTCRLLRQHALPRLLEVSRWVRELNSPQWTELSMKDRGLGVSFRLYSWVRIPKHMWKFLRFYQGE